MTPVVILALVFYGLYRGEQQARRERDQQFIQSQRNLRESLLHEAQAVRQTTVPDRRQKALLALSRAAKLDVGERDEAATGKPP